MTTLLRSTRLAAGLTLAALVLAACAGRGAYIDGAAGGGALSKHHTVLNIKIAGSNAQSKLHRMMVARRTKEGLNPKYVSLATNGIAVWAWTQGTTEPTNPTAVADVSASSPYCTIDSDGSGDRICAVPVSAPAGTDDFQVNGYDQPPSGNKVQGNELESGTTTGVVIQSGQANNVNVTFDGIIASLAMAPTWMTSQNDALTHVYNFAVNAFDADNYTIIDTAPFYNALNVAVQNDPTGTLTLVPPASGTDPRFYEVSYNGGLTNPSGNPDAQIVAGAQGVSGMVSMDFTPMIVAPQKLTIKNGSTATFTMQLAVPSDITPQSYQQFSVEPTVFGNCSVDGVSGASGFPVVVPWTSSTPVTVTVGGVATGNCTIEVIGPETYTGYAVEGVQVTVD